MAAASKTKQDVAETAESTEAATPAPAQVDPEAAASATETESAPAPASEAAGPATVVFRGSAPSLVESVGRWEPGETREVPEALAVRLCRNPLFTRTGS